MDLCRKEMFVETAQTNRRKELYSLGYFLMLALVCVCVCDDWMMVWCVFVFVLIG